jgi:hypothetical protein
VSIPGQYPAPYPPPSFEPAAARPPIPDSVRNGVTAMYAGAVFAAVSGVAGAFQAAHEVGDTAVAFAGFAGALGLFGGAVDVALWVWMAQANRRGHHWARVLGTVFFGFATLDVISAFFVSGFITHLNNLNNANGVSMNVPQASGLQVSLATVNFLIGLFALIMIWSKSARPFYRWQPGYPQVPGWGPQGTGSYGYQVPYQQQPPPYAGSSFPQQSPYQQQTPYPQQAPYPQAPSQQTLGQQAPSLQMPSLQTPSQAPPPAAGPADPWDVPGN